MARKTYLRYFVVTVKDQRIRVKEWAEDNRNYFPQYSFTNRSTDFPTTHQIASVLENKLNYTRKESATEVVLHPSK